MTSKMKKVIEVARARAAQDAHLCVVCHAPVTPADPSMRVGGGTAHLRCARYRPRRTRG